MTRIYFRPIKEDNTVFVLHFLMQEVSIYELLMALTKQPKESQGTVLRATTKCRSAHLVSKCNECLRVRAAQRATDPVLCAFVLETETRGHPCRKLVARVFSL